jgi:hypothetical protein
MAMSNLLNIFQNDMQQGELQWTSADSRSIDQTALASFAYTIEVMKGALPYYPIYCCTYIGGSFYLAKVASVASHSVKQREIHGVPYVSRVGSFTDDFYVLGVQESPQSEIDIIIVYEYQTIYQHYEDRVPISEDEEMQNQERLSEIFEAAENSAEKSLAFIRKLLESKDHSYE